MNQRSHHHLSVLSSTTLLAMSALHLLAEEQPVIKVPLKAKQAVRLVDIARQRSLANPIEFLVYGSTAEAGQQEIQRRLGAKLYELTTEYELSQDQQTKLKLAGELEAKQFFFEVDQLYRSYGEAKFAEDRNSIQEQAEPLYKRRLQLFGPRSFLSKVTDRTVTLEQRQKQEVLAKERLQLRHRSNVEGAIRDVERRVVLQIPQHESLVELLLCEIAPPKTIHEFDESLVKYQFSQLPQEKIKEILSDDQWTAVQELFDEFQKMKPLLVQYELITEPAALSKTTSVTLPVKESK